MVIHSEYELSNLPHQQCKKQRQDCLKDVFFFLLSIISDGHISFLDGLQLGLELNDVRPRERSKSQFQRRSNISSSEMPNYMSKDPF